MTVFVATSKRFYAEAAALCDEIRAAGHTVYHAFFDRDQDSIEADPELKQAVTRDHLAEIDACDVLYALAPGGYVGTSVVIEMAYAFARRKRVVTSEPVGEYAARALVSEVAAPADFLGALRVCGGGRSFQPVPSGRSGWKRAPQSRKARRSPGWTETEAP